MARKRRTQLRYDLRRSRRQWRTVAEPVRAAPATGVNAWDAEAVLPSGPGEGAESARTRPRAEPARLSGLLANRHVSYIVGVVALAWLPVGVGIAFLYLAGLRYWPGVLIGDLLANDYVALPLGSALGQTFGNVLEILAATVLLRRLVPGGDPLGNVAGLGRMLVAIAV